MILLKKGLAEFRSMRCGMILLAVVGGLTLLGGIFSPNHFYNSMVYLMALALLFLNLLLCSFKRFAVMVRAIGKKTGRGRWWIRQAGLIFLHAGILLIFIGAFVNAYQGQREVVSIPEEGSADVGAYLHIRHPFTIHLDRFVIDYHEDGGVSQYNSYIRISEAGQAGMETSISVNYPLRYHGVKAYQQSYGYLVRTKASFIGDGQIEHPFEEGQVLPVEGSNLSVKVYRYLPNFNLQHGMVSHGMRPDNPRVIISLYEGKKLTGVTAAMFGEKIKLDEESWIAFIGVKPYTVLQLKTDPGLGCTATGGTIFIMGLCLVFFIKPGQEMKQLHPIMAADE